MGADGGAVGWLSKGSIRKMVRKMVLGPWERFEFLGLWQMVVDGDQWLIRVENRQHAKKTEWCEAHGWSDDLGCRHHVALQKQTAVGQDPDTLCWHPQNKRMVLAGGMWLWVPCTPAVNIPLRTNLVFLGMFACPFIGWLTHNHVYFPESLVIFGTPTQPRSKSLVSKGILKWKAWLTITTHH